MWSRGGVSVFTLLAVLACPAVTEAQSATTADLQKEIENLNETQKAILKELQAIHQLLQQQQMRAAGDSLPAEPVEINGGASRGAANATVAVIEFSDFQCPYCARYDRETYPQILKEYVDTGKVKYVWRDLPLEIHKNAENAAEAARCAGEQEGFWRMHDRLFANQQSLTPPDLVRHAEALDLNSQRFQDCLESGRYAAAIRKDVADAGRAGVSGTPTFLIGIVQPNGSVKVFRKLVGARPYSEFKAAIDSLLGGRS